MSMMVLARLPAGRDATGAWGVRGRRDSKMTDLIAKVPAGVADADTALGYLLAQDWDLLGSPQDSDDPEIICKDNTRRAGWALRGIKGYADITCENGARTEPVGEQVKFLLGDLAHLCDALGMDFEEAVQYALRTYYRAEINR
jgi:hypothetical protein